MKTTRSTEIAKTSTAGLKLMMSEMSSLHFAAPDEARKSFASRALGKPRVGFTFVFVVALALLLASGAHAQVSNSLESLGSNAAVNKRAAHIESRSRVAIVQGRLVDRDNRLELGVNYGPVAAGDSYLFSQNLGAQADFHINPQFSLGVRYAKAFNSLSAEGQKRYEDADAARRAGAAYRAPAIAYPEQSVLGLVNWYMFYGKINFFDIKVIQFDIYSLAGYGQMFFKSGVNSGTSPTWTAGGGTGFWINEHFTSRFELRYQAYTDKVSDTSRDLNLIVANVGFGVLL